MPRWLGQGRNCAISASQGPGPLKGIESATVALGLVGDAHARLSSGQFPGRGIRQVCSLPQAAGS